MSAVVIGLGNPVLADDGVGLVVARWVRERLANFRDVEVVELHAGGLALVEAMAGRDRAAIVDAMVSGGRAGEIYRLGAEDLSRTRTARSSHEGSLGAAMELARVAGLRLPVEIRVWAVEAADVTSFREELTVPVEQAARQVVEEIGEAFGRRSE